MSERRDPDFGVGNGRGRGRRRDAPNLRISIRLLILALFLCVRRRSVAHPVRSSAGCRHHFLLFQRRFLLMLFVGDLRQRDPPFNLSMAPAGGAETSALALLTSGAATSGGGASTMTSVLSGFAFGMGLGGLTSGPPALAEQFKWPEPPPPLTVPKATCGRHDHAETALQGQVPSALRARGFQGFNCNLELIGQVRGDGANWQTEEFREQRDEFRGYQYGRGYGNRVNHTCAYHGTAFTTFGRTHVGVPVIDMTNPSGPTATGYLTTVSMLDPWESLKTNTRRQLLAADDAHNAGVAPNGGPEVDVYDLSVDCRYPQLLASKAVGTGTDGGVLSPEFPRGHEGAWAPDGLTYYRSDIGNNTYSAIDMSDPTRPKQIAFFNIAAAVEPSGIFCHGLSVTDDGNRAYVAVLGGMASRGTTRRRRRPTASRCSTRARCRRANLTRKSN